MNEHSHIPDGFHSVTPSLTVKDCSAAIDFYTRAFGAVERFRMDGEGGKVMHAEIMIGNSLVMLSDEFPDWGAVAPDAGEGALYMIYVEDADATFARALACGATEIMPVEDQFYGDRTGRLADPHGYRWSIAQHVRDISPEEMEEATKQWMSDNAE